MPTLTLRRCGRVPRSLRPAAPTRSRTLIARSRAGWRRPRPNARLDEHGRRRGRGTLWIAERCGENDCLANGDIAPILQSARRRWLGAFGAGLFAWPHGIYVDAGGNVWVTDARGGEGRGHQVIKFAPTAASCCGSARRRTPATGQTHFNGPTDVVVAPNGDVFVSDGHEPMSNNRIVKFSRDGRFIKEWGGTGSAPGQFLVPHALALDSHGRLFVADRDNNRIQIFDQDGNFLEQWTQFGRPSGIHIAADDTLYVSDNQSNDERHPRLAARHLRRQRERRHGQRFHSGPRVRSGAGARDRRARPRGRRGRARSTAPRSIRRASRSTPR